MFGRFRFWKNGYSRYRTYCKSNNEKNNKSKWNVSQSHSKLKSVSNLRVGLYTTGAVFAVIGLSYASVPLYRIFCSVTGFGGTVQKTHNPDFSKGVDESRQIKVSFTSQVSSTLPWSFVPIQDSVIVNPGEKVLAIFKAYNHSDEPLIGVATYNVVPDGAGQYFNKIQCFCFDEQRINAKSEVYMPVHFYVDTDILKNPKMKDLNEITLSYTFFLSDDQDMDWIIEEREKENQKKAIAVKKYTL